MALWGTKELYGSLGTCEIDVSTKILTTSGNKLVTSGIQTGDVCTIGAGATYGYAIVKEVTSASTCTLVSVENLVSPHNSESGTDVPAGAALQISQEPLYIVNSAAGNYYAPEIKTTAAHHHATTGSGVLGFSTSHIVSGIYGVDTAEQQEAVDDNSPYKPAHAGWVGITTYVDQHGNLRVKTETFVAMGKDHDNLGGIQNDATGDFDDDAILPDS